MLAVQGKYRTITKYLVTRTQTRNSEPVIEYTLSSELSLSYPRRAQIVEVHSPAGSTPRQTRTTVFVTVR